MLYTLEQGPHEKKIIEQAYRQRMPLPPKIANAPELQVGLEFYYSAFLELTSCRFLGFGEGPISYLAMQNYCEVNDVVGEQRDDLVYHIQQMDAAYLKWRGTQLEKK